MALSSDLTTAGLGITYAPGQNGAADRYFTTDAQGANREITGANAQTFSSLGLDPTTFNKVSLNAVSNGNGAFKTIDPVSGLPFYSWSTSGGNIDAGSLGNFLQSQASTVINTKAANAKVQTDTTNNAAMNAGQPTVAPIPANQLGNGLDANGNKITTPTTNTNINPNNNPVTTTVPTNQSGNGLPTLANGQSAGGLQMPTGPDADSTFNPLTGQQQAPGLQMPSNGSDLVFDPTTGQQVSKSQAAFNATQASGKTAPQDSSSASTAVNSAIQSVTPSDNSKQIAAVENTLANDPGYQKLLADANASQTTAANSETLANQYQDLLTQYNIPGINTELLNDQAIINGTEDDIRHEVTAAGGFATDSQVLALASARNKTLITNYNNLVAQKTDLMSQINTISGLEGQDKQIAITQANNQLNADAQLADYAQKFTANAQAGYNNVISAVGYSGLYSALSQSGDPNAVSLAEQTLGLAPGELQQLGTQADTAAQVDLQLKQTQLQQAKTDLADTPAKDAAALAASQASTNASNTSAAKTAEDLAFEKSNNGLTPDQVAAQNTAQQTQEHQFDTNAATLIGNMANKSINWNTAWNELHAQYPNLSTQTIDNALNATDNRAKYGG